VARALEELHHEQLDEVAGLVAYHHSKAGNAREAVPLLLRFSERAWRLHGINEALAALEQALVDSARLPAAERVPSAIAIVLQQAKCFAFLGRMRELIARLAQYEPALAELDQPALSGPFYFWWGFAETLLGARSIAQERTERALAQASLCEDQLIIGYSHSLLSYLCAVRGRPDQGIQHGLTGTSLLGTGATLPEGAVIAWLNLGLNYHARGDWRNAMAAAEHASALARAAESKRGESLAAAAIASIFALTERWEEALAYCARAVEASQEPFTMVHALWVFGWAQTGSGRPDMAIAVLERALAELEQHGMRGFMVVGLVYLAEAQLAHGDAQSALSSAQRALVVARESEAVWVFGMALRTAGCAALALQHLDSARSQLGEALVLFEGCAAQLEIGHTLYWQAKLEWAVGERDLARATLARARAVFVALEVERAVARLDLTARELSLS
jgi:tetratricopeptide (TPR) repeat protein